jgi:hypothetical protein
MTTVNPSQRAVTGAHAATPKKNDANTEADLFIKEHKKGGYYYQFALDLANQPEAVQKAIIGKISENDRLDLSIRIAWMCDPKRPQKGLPDLTLGLLNPSPADITKLKKLINFRNESQLAGTRIITGSDSKTGEPKYHRLSGFSYLPIGSEASETARIVC